MSTDKNAVYLSARSAGEKRRLFSLVPIFVMALELVLSSCTTKGTTKATTDPTTDIVSSTSGRGWLTQDGLIKADQKAQAFATVTFENLQQDMAQGHGEYLASLWALVGGRKDQEAAFSARTQAAYTLLFPPEHTTPKKMLGVLNKEVLISAPNP